MGLFGPSWSWEEIKKKDNIMNDIKKEDDRVLKETEKMLDRQRILRERNYKWSTRRKYKSNFTIAC